MFVSPLEGYSAPLPCLFIRNFIQNGLCRLRLKENNTILPTMLAGGWSLVFSPGFAPNAPLVFAAEFASVYVYATKWQGLFQTEKKEQHPTII